MISVCSSCEAMCLVKGRHPYPISLTVYTCTAKVTHYLYLLRDADIETNTFLLVMVLSRTALPLPYVVRME